MSLLLSFLLMCIGFGVLGFGADTLISGAASVAKRFGLSARLIGLTFIATGTSLPEIVLSFHTSMIGDPLMAVGNAIGSNIINIGLILGITVIITPIEIRSETLHKEWPLLFLVTLIVGLLMLDGSLNRVDGGLLVLGGIFMIFWLIQQGMKKHKLFHRDILESEYQQEIQSKESVLKPISQLFFGFLMLPLGSQIVVQHSIEIANFFHISHLVIGLTIFSFGTSLPELATSIAGARKKEYDIIIGNIIGSNIFNLLAVLAIPALIQTIPLQMVLIRDYVAMFLLTVLFLLFAFRLNGIRYMSRFEGSVLVGVYFVYLISLFFIV